MSHQRFYEPIIECLRSAGDAGAPVSEIYGAVRRSGVHIREAQERGASFAEYDWKHSVRCAMQHLKQRGDVELLGNRWRVCTNRGKTASVDVDASSGNKRESNRWAGQDDAANPAEQAAASSALSISLRELDVGTRLRNCLGRYGAETVADILSVEEDDFAQLRGVGKKTLRLLKDLKNRLIRSHPELGLWSSEEHGSRLGTTCRVDYLSLVSPLDSQPMSGRLKKSLELCGAASVGDVLAVDDEGFVNIPEAGRDTVEELHQLQEQIIREAGLHRDIEPLYEVECGANNALTAPIAGLPVRCLVTDTSLQALFSDLGIFRVRDVFDLARQAQDAAAAMSEEHEDRLSAAVDRIRRIDLNFRNRVGSPQGPLPDGLSTTVRLKADTLRETLTRLTTADSLCEVLRKHVEACLAGRVAQRETDCVLRKLALSPEATKRARLDDLTESSGLRRARIKELIALVQDRCGDSHRTQHLSPLFEIIRTLFEGDVSFAHIDDVREALQGRFGWETRPTRNDVRLLVSWMPDVEMASTTTVRQADTAASEDSESEIALDAPIESLRNEDLLPARHLLKWLRKAGARTVEDVLQLTGDQFRAIKGVGKGKERLLLELQRRLREDTGWEKAASAGTRHCVSRTWAILRARRRRSLRDFLIAVACAYDKDRGSLRHRRRNTTVWLWYRGLLDDEDHTLADIAERLELTRGRVQQIVARQDRVIRKRLLREEREFCNALDRVFASFLGVAPLEAFVTECRTSFGFSMPVKRRELECLHSLLESSPHKFRLLHGGLLAHNGACSALWRQAQCLAGELIEATRERQHILDFAYRLRQRLSERCWGDPDELNEAIPCCGARRGEVELPESYVRAVIM